MKFSLKRNKLPFPLGKPNWPIDVDKPTPKSKLGANFETDWSRTYLSRAIRSLITDYVTRPAIEVVASPTIHGLDNLANASSPIIFAANHASHIDTPLLLSSLPERFRHKTAVGAGADYFFDKKYKAILWSFLLAAIPIERNKVSRRSHDLALKVIEDGWNLVLFPEGGRTPDGFGQEFKGGLAQIALKGGAKIVPVHIAGTYEILGKGRSFKRGETAIYFDRPIDPTGRSTKEVIAEVERRVDRLADEVASDFWNAALNQGAGLTPKRNADEKDWIADWNRPRYRSDAKKRVKKWPRLPIIDKPL